MNNRQLFVFVLALVYYITSLVFLLLPLIFSDQQAELARQYTDILPVRLFVNLLMLLIVLHLMIVLSLILIAFGRKRVGLWLLVVFGGLWLALQLTLVEDHNFIRPVAEVLILMLCLVAFGKRAQQLPEAPSESEIADNE
ncbi:MAG TPA: hypothetical protein PKE03_11515 [Bacteroidales bacterium]|nr:hypothetical protein [Bacteroidales bacterium]